MEISGLARGTVEPAFAVTSGVHRGIPGHSTFGGEAHAWRMESGVGLATISIWQPDY